MALAQNPSITELSLRKNHIGDAGASALARNPVLQVLDLYRNQVGDVGSEALSKSESITDLDININLVNNEGGKVFLDNTVLTKLSLVVKKKAVQQELEGAITRNIYNQQQAKKHWAVLLSALATGYLYDRHG